MPLILPSFAGTLAPATASFTPNALSASLDGTDDYVGIAGLASRSLGALSMWVNITSANGIHSNGSGAGSLGMLAGLRYEATVSL